MKQRYTAFDLNHKQVNDCSKLRKLLSKPNTAKNQKRIMRIKKQLGCD